KRRVATTRADEGAPPRAPPGADRPPGKGNRDDRAAPGRRGASSARNRPLCRRLRLRREVRDQESQLLPEIRARNDHVDHPVVEEVFSALEALGELFADGLLDHSLARETDQRTRLGL